jgi:hypothetical protein
LIDDDNSNGLQTASLHTQLAYCSQHLLLFCTSWYQRLDGIVDARGLWNDALNSMIEVQQPYLLSNSSS